MYDIITIGSGTIDVFAQAESELITIKTSHDSEDLIAFPVGSKLIMEKLLFTVGGGGTNAAAAISKLGLKVSWLGKVGDDSNAQMVLDYLADEKVDGSLIVHGKGNTGYSVILDSLKHDRAILVCKGVNNDMLEKEIDFDKLRTRWFYSSSMMAQSFTTLEKIFSYAKKNGIKTMFNPSSYQAKKGSVFLSRILVDTDIIVMNKEEAELLVGCGETCDLMVRLHKLGPGIAIITDGSAGVFVSDSKTLYTAKPPKVKVVDSTGAGDAFGSSFLAGIVRKGDIGFAMQLGIANATSVIEHYSSKHRLLSWDEARKRIKRQRIKVLKKKL